MEVLAGLRRGLAAFNSVDDRRQPVGHIQGGRLTRQQMIAQGAQHDRQVAEQSFRGGIVLALAMSANPRDQGVGGGALGVESVDGGTRGRRVMKIVHERFSVGRGERERTV